MNFLVFAKNDEGLRSYEVADAGSIDEAIRMVKSALGVPRALALIPGTEPLRERKAA